MACEGGGEKQEDGKSDNSFSKKFSALWKSSISQQSVLISCILESSKSSAVIMKVVDIFTAVIQIALMTIIADEQELVSID
eukprot:767451-Hanusia_phi.AAC.9